MGNLENKEVQTNTEEKQTNTEETQIDEQELKERERLYNKAVDRVNELGLNWTFRSIEFVVNREGITFNQLRSCVFRGKDNDVKYDVEQATKLLIASGLVNSNTCSKDDYNNCLDKAYEIMEDWRQNFGFIGILHIIIIGIMERKHFFMGTQDLKILEHLASKNLQQDIAMNSIAVDMQTKVSQSQAMQY